MTFFSQLQFWARRLKQETLALYLAARHPLTPWLARLIIAGLVAYALSPIDLIPDFIPVLGYLDDVILLPLGIALVLRLIPPAVMEECRESAQQRFAAGKPVSRTAGFIIVLIWLLALGWLLRWIQLAPSLK
jgi:uncharacterized membrane protein YkvA (DUF1232 family)